MIRDKAHYHKVYQARVYAKSARLKPQPHRTDWTTPAKAGYLCDMCGNTDRPTPHPRCEADRRRAAACIGVPPEDTDRPRILPRSKGDRPMKTEKCPKCGEA